MPRESAELTQLHNRLLLLEDECRKIGRFPPRPTTLRASAGAFFVSMVRRALFWYTPPVRNSIGGLVQIAEDTIRLAAGLEARLQEQAQQDRRRTDALETSLQEQADALQQDRRRTADLEARLQEQAGALQRTTDLETRFQEQADTLLQDRQHAVALETRLKEQAGALQQDRQRTTDLETRLQMQADILLQDRQRTAAIEARLQEQADALQQDRQHTAGIESGLREQMGTLQDRTMGLEHRLSGTDGCPLQSECPRMAEFDKRLQEQAGTVAYDRQRTTGLENRFQEHFAEQGHPLREELETLRQERSRIAELLQQERLCSIELETRLREQVDSFEQLHEDSVSREETLTRRLLKTEERLHSLKLEILTQSRRVSHLLEEARKRLPESSDGGPLRAFEQEALHDLDSLYLSFEDEFRGTQEEIRQRLSGYLPFLNQAQTGARETAVLDIGCGRGEWLALLRQEGFPARGVDSNRLMIEECRTRQLEVEEADALEYLGRLPEGSVGNITVFHMVEHLPFRNLVRLLDEVARVLQPGGVAIFETPNPDNILVGARNFYYDPTHRNPIPSATLRFLVESRGLCQVQVLPLNPCDPCNHVPDAEGNPLVQRFNDYFYGPQDYAVVGKKV